jgi:hypothetical protein
VDTSELVAAYNLSDVMKGIGNNNNHDNANKEVPAEPPRLRPRPLDASPAPEAGAVVAEGKPVAPPAKGRRSRNPFLSGLASISQQIQPLQQLGRPGLRPLHHYIISLSLVEACTYCLLGIQAVAALDVYSEEELGEELIPSKEYPSDHLSIAADLQLLW